MKIFSKVVAGVFVGAVFASLPITYIQSYGINQEFHAVAAIVGAGVCLFVAAFFAFDLSP